KRRSEQGTLGVSPQPGQKQGPAVRNLDAPAGSGSAGQPGQAGSGGPNRQSTGAQQNGQPGQQDGQGQPGAKGQQRNGTGKPVPGTGSGSSGNGQGQGPDGSGSPGGARNRTGSPYDRHLDEGGGSGLGSGSGGAVPPNQTTPGKGGHHAGGGVDQTGTDGQKGQLQFLPGTVEATQARSGVLPLPGDPNSPWAGSKSSPSFRKAVETAVDDPRLPPEYQELLRAYYR
ncbi:MAG TPA: hypothetical protein VHN99_10560, partial [Deinococcales bacterium]|nr:hypothetical protein [Deinococcales bacterium]